MPGSDDQGSMQAVGSREDDDLPEPTGRAKMSLDLLTHRIDVEGLAHRLKMSHQRYIQALSGEVVDLICQRTWRDHVSRATG